MIIGIPKETKPEENRVSMTPAGVEIVGSAGHAVRVETGAGAGSGFTDDEYRTAGADIADSTASVFSDAEMVLRVKEPQADEYGLLKKGQIYFSYLHLAASETVAKALLDSGAVAIGYETVQRDDGKLPLLTPMSEVAGPMAIQQGAKYLEMAQGGQGVLLGGVPGVDPGNVMILGGGQVGLHAAVMAAGFGAKVWVFEIRPNRLRYLSDVLPPNCVALKSSPADIRDVIRRADVVVGAVLEPGGRTPILVTREMVRTMRPGAVMVDVAIDQGGVFETSRPTTHSDPIFIEEGVVHYAVGNMPGALPKTSTMALTNATLPYVLQIADKGWAGAMKANPDIRRGANIIDGKVTHEGVAEALGLGHTPIDSLL